VVVVAWAGRKVENLGNRFWFSTLSKARHFHGLLAGLCELRQRRGFALPQQLDLGRVHPESALGVADRQRSFLQFRQTHPWFQKPFRFWKRL
jgi:hypothetical protein